MKGYLLVGEKSHHLAQMKGRLRVAVKDEVRFLARGDKANAGFFESGFQVLAVSGVDTFVIYENAEVLASKLFDLLFKRCLVLLAHIVFCSSPKGRFGNKLIAVSTLVIRAEKSTLTATDSLALVALELFRMLTFLPNQTVAIQRKFAGLKPCARWKFPVRFRTLEPMRYITLTLLSLILLAPFPSSATGVEAASEDAPLVILRGRVKCLGPACDTASGGFEFSASTGQQYTFFEGDELAHIFKDPRVRSRELQISARLHAKNRLEIIKVKSVVDGRLHDLYYFCEVCNITAYAPGPCPCCRNELEFFEKPLP